jgi:hypothetical protein
MADIPDGIPDFSVAQMAVAWAIAKEAVGYAHGQKAEDPEGRTDILCDLFNRAYYALL